MILLLSFLYIEDFHFSLLNYCRLFIFKKVLTKSKHSNFNYQKINLKWIQIVLLYSVSQKMKVVKEKLLLMYLENVHTHNE